MEDLPDPAHKSKDKTAHKESPASRGPDSREHSTAKPSRDIDYSIAHSSTHRTTHKSNPPSRGPDLREHSKANSSGLSKGPFLRAITHQGVQVIVLQPPHQSQPHAKLERLDSKLTPLQKR